MPVSTRLDVLLMLGDVVVGRFVVELSSLDLLVCPWMRSVPDGRSSGCLLQFADSSFRLVDTFRWFYLMLAY